MSAKGRVVTMTTGFLRDPRLATMTKYTRTTPTAIEMKMAWNPSAMSANIPPLVMDTPGGSDNATIFLSISRPTCCVSSALCRL